MEKIAALVHEKKIDGIADLRDESDRNGIRIVMDLKRGAIADIIINSLYKFTPLETSFGINMMAVVGKRPMLLNLKEVLSYFLDHRREVIIRRTKFDLDKCEKRVHILEGLRIALDNIDEVVKLIRASGSPDEARVSLMERFELSEIQAKAILDMRLQKLTGLEQDKLLEELTELMKKIEYFINALNTSKDSDIIDEFRNLLKEIGTDRAQADIDTLPVVFSGLRKALAADDSRSMCAMHRAILTDLEFSPYIAGNGEEAYDYVEQGEIFDIVITDMNMPVMDGMELVSKLRNTPGYENIPIIMVTTESEASQQNMAEKAGVTTFVTKPFKPETLKEKILEVLS